MKFRLIVVGTAEDLEGRIALLTELFQKGLETLHIRTRLMDEDALRAFILTIPAGFHPRLIVHSHYDLANEFDLKGIHLTERTRKFNVPYFAPAKQISASFHTVTDLIDNTFPFSYAFLSPVFDSISKPGYKRRFNPEEWRVSLRLYRETNKNPCPLIALGGVRESNLHEVRKMGFDGGAVMGAIWNNPDPVSEYIKLKKQVDEMK